MAKGSEHEQLNQDGDYSEEQLTENVLKAGCHMMVLRPRLAGARQI